MKTISIFVAILSLGVILTCSSSALAQVTASGTLTGQVKDSQGSSVSGAEVTLFDIEKNASQTAMTNESGRFTFVNIHPGLYDVTVSKSGFKVSKLSQQKVTIGLVLTLEITLEVGALTETVVVTSVAGTELQTTNATIGATLSAKQLEQLTNFGRDANALFVLQPATTPGGSVAGAVVDQNTFQLDGGNNSSDMDGTQNVYTQASGFIGSAAAGGTPSGVLPTPAESVEEFRVATNNQTSDFNGSAGAQIQMVTKRGTNSWHGSGYWYYFGTNFSANSWTNNRTNTPKAITHQNRWGFSAGGPILPDFLGGKTYLFGNYEGRRFPQTVTFERLVPTPLFRAGVIQVQNSGTGAVPVTVNGVTYPVGAWVPYNLNPTAVTVNGVTYQPANVCGTGGNQPCDPRGIGLNPIVRQIWTQFMPLPNNPSAGDQFNTQGYRSNLPLPQQSDFFVARIDHDFGPKWRFMGSYRVYDFSQLANTQVDIGGSLPGNTLGQMASSAPRVQKPSYYVAGLTTNIKPTLINDFRYSFLRNFWEWGTAAAPPQLPGLGGALEIGGESANALIPVNVNAQNARSRFWDGLDHTLRDDVTWIKGNHTFTFGGSYQRNFNYHQRNDNGQSTMTSITYIVQGGQSGFSMTGFRPGTLPAGGTQNNAFDNLYAQALGLVTLPQVVYTRAGQDLRLQPLGTPAFDKAIIPTYSAYFNDTWRMTPTLTVSYGLNYTVEMPPYEIDGKQVMLVDDTGNAITTRDYLARREAAALAGQVYNPVLGFATIRNVKGEQRKYPFEPYYKGFSPSISAAWNPRFDDGILGTLFGNGRTVFRGGYRRVIGRMNGVGLVLIPLLGTGLLQTVQCEGAVRAAFAVGGNQCLGTGQANPNNGFRIGTDGGSAPLATASATLPQPYYPGVAGNISAGDGSVLDPEFQPNISDQWSFSIQREFIPNKLLVEVGYIGRNITKEWQQMNLDAVPHMTTLSGQPFSAAFANLYRAVSGNQPIVAQPWFEAALGGPASAYCTGFASCTAAVASRQAANIRSTLVYSLWTNLESQTSWTLGRTLGFSSRCENRVVPGLNNGNTAVPVCAQYRSIFMNTSNGWGNYHAGFASVTIRDWHGFTSRQNFTWSHALGTGAEVQARSSRSVINPWDLDVNYGAQDFDIRLLYNLSVLYEPPFFKEQRGIVGRLLGGWTIAPLFAAQSGLPLRVNVNTGVNANCQSFGEMNCNSGSAWENAVLISPFTGGNTLHPNVIGSGGVGTNANPAIRGSGMNIFADPAAVLGQFRRLILGVDGRGGAAGPMRGFPRWNLDLSVSKEVRWSERFGTTFSVQFANVLNHFQPADPTLSIDTPASWGVVTGAAYNPREIEFGVRVRF